jgi:capsular polysaccharide biosynthesis protein/MinD-like ATPase involved in chromosome partitioning or flagellar assembly
MSALRQRTWSQLLVFSVLGGYWAVRTKRRKLAQRSDGVKATGVTKAFAPSAGHDRSDRAKWALREYDLVETLAPASRDEHLSGPVMNPSTNVPHPQPAARRQIEFLKRQAPLIILVVATALGVAAAASFTQPKVYRASAKIFVGSGGTLQPQFGNNIQPFTQTMSDLLASDIVASRVIQDLGLNETTKTLLSHLQVSSTPDSAVLRVSYDSHNRGEAIRILDRIAAVFTTRVQRTVGRASGPNAPVITATVWDPAHASTTPISPHPTQTMALAGIIGLALGIILGLLRDTLDERIHRGDEMEDLLGAPVVAALPKSVLGRAVVDRKRGLDLAHIHAIDPLRMELSRADSQERLITVTSGGAGDGKSTVAASLGVALALAGEDVICVDVVPSKHGLSSYLNLSSLDGAGGKPLTGPIDLREALRDVRLEPGAGNANLEPVPAPLGIGTEDSPAGLSPLVGQRERGRLQVLVLGHGALSGQDGFPSWSIADLVTDLKTQANYVVVDAPAIPSGTTFALLSVSDTAIIVAREAKTTKEQARSVRNALETIRVPSYAVVSVGLSAAPIPPYGRARTSATQGFSSSRARRAR